MGSSFEWLSCCCPNWKGCSRVHGLAGFRVAGTLGAELKVGWFVWCARGSWHAKQMGRKQHSVKGQDPLLHFLQISLDRCTGGCPCCDGGRATAREVDSMTDISHKSCSRLCPWDLRVDCCCILGINCTLNIMG